MADIVVTYEDFTGAIKVDKFGDGQHVVDVGNGGVLTIRGGIGNQGSIVKAYSLNVWKTVDLAE